MYPHALILAMSSKIWTTEGNPLAAASQMLRSQVTNMPRFKSTASEN